MSDFLLAPFQYEYMQRAFVAALVVGTLCSTIGTYVVLRKLSFIGDGIAHASFAGIVVAYLRGLDYYVGAMVVAVLTALGIGFVNRRGKVSLDSAIGVLFTGAFALGVFLMSRLPHYNVDLSSFLFGNILAVSRQDLRIDLGPCGHRCRFARAALSRAPVHVVRSDRRGGERHSCRIRRVRVARFARADDYRLARIGRHRARGRVARHPGRDGVSN